MWMAWPEIFSFVVIVIGFIISVATRSAIISYITILLCGLYFGRMWFNVQKTIKAPWLLIIFCFLLGYLFGNFYGDPKVIIILFILGMIGGFYTFHKKWLIIN